MHQKSLSFALVLLFCTSINQSWAIQPPEKCFETSEGLEICIKQKINHNPSDFTQQDADQLAQSLPKIPSTYVDALMLYLQSTESGTADPREIEKVLTEVFNIPPQYHSSLQAGLKLISQEEPKNTDAIKLITQIMKANNAPDALTNTIQSYFAMQNEERDQKAEEQFMQSGISLFKLIIEASKHSNKDETE